MGKELIKSIFLKSLAGFGGAPALVLGFNIDFEVMKPVLDTVAVSNSLLALLQRDPTGFIVECLETRRIPEYTNVLYRIFTNYGFLEWNHSHFVMVEQILKSFLGIPTEGMTRPPNNQPVTSVR